MTFIESAQFLGRVIARAVKGPGHLARATKAATLSVAQTLSDLVRAQLAGDIRRIKESQITRLEAETAQKVSDAVRAANEATNAGVSAALVLAEAEVKRADAAKTLAEADAIRRDAATRQFEAMSKAKAELITALAQLRAQGGELLLDSEAREMLLRQYPPEPDRDK